MNLKRKNAIAGFIVIIVIFGVGSTVTISQLNNLKTKQVTQVMKNSMNVLMKSVESSAQQALEQASVFSKLSQVIQAFNTAHSGDINDPLDPQGQQARDMLRLSLQSAMDAYKTVTNTAMKLHFHLPNGRSLVRMWRPKQIKIFEKWQDRSDDISDFRNTVLDVNRTGKPVKGIELGRGGFVIRGLVPIAGNQGETIGSVEVLRDFAPLVKTIFSTVQYNFMLFMNKEFLSITHRLQNLAKYPIIANKYVQVMGQEIEGQGPESMTGVPPLSLIDRGKNGFFIHLDGKKATAAFPIKDYNGTQIGVMVLDADTSNEDDLIRNLIIFQIMMLMLFLIVLGLSSSFFFSRTVLKPLFQFIDISEKLSGGDLRHSIDVTSGDEMGSLAKTINFMIQTLGGMVGKIISVVTQLKANTNEINQALQNQVASTSEQSASVSQITSTMAEFSASSRQIAEHADMVLGIAEEAMDYAGKGENSVSMITEKMEEIHTDDQDTVKGVHELGKKTHEIARIMDIINNIADQTKLIAFNAALEASSAGESGKRFSVVAVEIRRLAESVEASTRETEKRVSEIQDAVNKMMLASEKKTHCINTGLTFISHTRETLVNIVAKTQKTRDAAQQITLSTQQQKTASEQVVHALKEIDDSGRQTALTVTQIGESGQTLKQLTAELSSLVSGFKI